MYIYIQTRTGYHVEVEIINHFTWSGFTFFYTKFGFGESFFFFLSHSILLHKPQSGQIIFNMSTFAFIALQYRVVLWGHYYLQSPLSPISIALQSSPHITGVFRNYMSLFTQIISFCMFPTLQLFDNLVKYLDTKWTEITVSYFLLIQLLRIILYTTYPLKLPNIASYILESMLHTNLKTFTELIMPPCWYKSEKTVNAGLSSIYL